MLTIDIRYLHRWYFRTLEQRWKLHKARTLLYATLSRLGARRPISPPSPLREFSGSSRASFRTLRSRAYLRFRNDEVGRNRSNTIWIFTIFEVFIGMDIVHHFIVRYEVIIATILFVVPWRPRCIWKINEILVPVLRVRDSIKY